MVKEELGGQESEECYILPTLGVTRAHSLCIA